MGERVLVDPVEVIRLPTGGSFTITDPTGAVLFRVVAGEVFSDASGFANPATEPLDMDGFEVQNAPNLPTLLADPGNVWEAETVVVEGYRIAQDGGVFEVTTPGTTDVSPPTWTYDLQEVSDGTAGWLFRGGIGQVSIPAIPTDYIDARMTALSDDTPEVSGVGDAGVGTAASRADHVHPETGVLLSATVDLSAAQIATLDSVPVEIIPAPGANKAIVLVSAALQFVGGNVAFTTDPVALLTAGATGFTFGDPTPVGFDNADIESLTAGVLGADGVDMVNAEDQPAMFTAVGAPGGSGNGTARITVLYWVMDLIGPS